MNSNIQKPIHRPLPNSIPPGVKITPHPIPEFPEQDPFKGGHKFIFIAMRETTISQTSDSITQRLKRFLSKANDDCSISVGRIFLDKPNMIDILHLENIDPRADAIIETCQQITKKIEDIEELYCDIHTFKFLSDGNFFNLYCMERNYSFALNWVDRHFDPAIRQLAIKGPFQRGEIGLTDKLREDKKLVEKLVRLDSDAIETDSVSGAITTSLLFR